MMEDRRRGEAAGTRGGPGEIWSILTVNKGSPHLERFFPSELRDQTSHHRNTSHDTIVPLSSRGPEIWAKITTGRAESQALNGQDTRSRGKRRTKVLGHTITSEYVDPVRGTVVFHSVGRIERSYGW